MSNESSHNFVKTVILLKKIMCKSGRDGFKLAIYNRWQLIQGNRFWLF
jgi:hypothetical protein